MIPRVNFGTLTLIAVIHAMLAVVPTLEAAGDDGSVQDRLAKRSADILEFKAAVKGEGKAQVLDCLETLCQTEESIWGPDHSKVLQRLKTRKLLRSANDETWEIFFDFHRSSSLAANCFSDGYVSVAAQHAGKAKTLAGEVFGEHAEKTISATQTYLAFCFFQNKFSQAHADETVLGNSLNEFRLSPGLSASQRVRAEKLAAQVYAKQGRFQEGIDLLSPLLVIEKRAASHASVVVTATQLGGLYVRKQDIVKAKQLESEVSHSFAKLGKLADRYRPGLFTLQSLIARQQGDASKADRLGERAARTALANYGANSPFLLATLLDVTPALARSEESELWDARINRLVDRALATSRP